MISVFDDDGMPDFEGRSDDALLASLEARKFDFLHQPSKPVPILSVQGSPLGTPGNLMNIQGAPKVGKSAVVESIIAALLTGESWGADTLGFEGRNPENRTVIHYDTEQSRYDHDSLVRKALRRIDLSEGPTNLHSFSLVDIPVEDRRRSLRAVMAKTAENCGGIIAVLIDGVADLLSDPNNPEESFALVDELHQLATTYHCLIITALHENPGSPHAKTRGHLGSQLERKAETNLRLEKDKEGVTTMWVERGRHCYMPKSNGACFSWNHSCQMHTSLESVGSRRIQEARREAEEDVGRCIQSGESLLHKDLMKRIRSELGVGEKTAKNRIRHWKTMKIVRHENSLYSLAYSGEGAEGKQG